MIQKKRGRLFFVGILFVASIALAFRFPVLWIPCIIVSLTGLYLMIWATAGQGRWCRQCKTFRFFRS